MGQIVVAEKHYVAGFEIERYPHGSVSEDLLISQVSAWLLENDTDRLDPIDFQFVVEAMDEQVADVELSIDFTEYVKAAEDPNGKITIQGKTYTLS